MKQQEVFVGNRKFVSKTSAIKSLIKLGRGKSRFAVIAEKVGCHTSQVSQVYSWMVKMGIIVDTYVNTRGPHRSHIHA